MINIPIAEENLDEEEDSFELEVMADKKSTGKYKFKKSDMKSLLIGKNNKTSTEARKVFFQNMSIFWPKNYYSSKKSMCKKNKDISNC